jgi:hypothetical protein
MRPNPSDARRSSREPAAGRAALLRDGAEPLCGRLSNLSRHGAMLMVTAAAGLPAEGEEGELQILTATPPGCRRCRVVRVRREKGLAGLGIEFLD